MHAHTLLCSRSNIDLLISPYKQEDSKQITLSVSAEALDKTQISPNRHTHIKAYVHVARQNGRADFCINLSAVIPQHHFLISHSVLSLPLQPPGFAAAPLVAGAVPNVDPSFGRSLLIGTQADILLFTDNLKGVPVFFCL